MLSGISYSDYWKMTFGEVEDVVSFFTDERKKQREQQEKNLLLNSYYSGYFSRVRPFPRKIETVFPKLFGREKDGSISATNTVAIAAAMDRFMSNFKKTKRGE